MPDYRKVAAPIMQIIQPPFGARTTELLNVMALPDGIREHMSDIVPLNQGTAELESLVSEHEAQNRQLQLGVFAGDLYMAIWNKNPGRRYTILALYWSISPASVRGVLGQIRAALAEFVVKLRAGVGNSDQLPSADQTAEALRATLPSAVFNNSSVTFMSTKEGDIMPDGDRTTIKGNTTKIEGASGTISVASANVNQVNAEGMDVEKIREFAALIAQIAPTLGLAEVEQAELESGADELRAAVSTPVPEKGRVRRAVDRVMGCSGGLARPPRGWWRWGWVTS